MASYKEIRQYLDEYVSILKEVENLNNLKRDFMAATDKETYIGVDIDKVARYRFDIPASEAAAKFNQEIADKEFRLNAMQAKLDSIVL